MLYEEKREVRLQISQLLADAGLTQKTIKDMVDRAIQQILVKLNSESSSGDYICEKINDYINSSFGFGSTIRTQVANALKDRIINISFDKSVTEDK